MPPLEKVTAHLVIRKAFLALEKQERRTDFTPREIYDWVDAHYPGYARSTIQVHLHSAMSTGKGHPGSKTVGQVEQVTHGVYRLTEEGRRRAEGS